MFFLSNYINMETKLLIHKPFIRSNFSYCPLVWHFCSKSSTLKLEKLQYRALRLQYSDYTSSYEDLLLKAYMSTLEFGSIRNIGAAGADLQQTDISPPRSRSFQYHHHTVNIHRTRSFPGADIGSDHDLVMMTFLVRLKKTRKPN